MLYVFKDIFVFVLAGILLSTHHTYKEDDKIIVKIENICPTPEHVDTDQIT